MRIDSCRKCGEGLAIKQECSVCKKPLKFTCKKDHFESDEQIHPLCKLAGMSQNQAISEAA